MEPVVLFVLLILSGFFSGSETALTSLSIARAKALAKESRTGAHALLQLKQNATRMLVIILIGNNLVNIGASALATVLATEWFGHIGPGIAVGVLTILILVFGEVTPKSWAAHHPERIALFAAPLILNFGRLTFPAVWVFERFANWIHNVTAVASDPTVTESEVISLIEYGAKEGTIEDGEMAMIERIFEFNDSEVRDVMTSRNEVFSLSGDLRIQDALHEILKGSASRIPVYSETPDNVVGVIHLRDVLQTLVEGQQDASLESIAHEPLFIPQTQTIDESFDLLRRSKRHLALVVNEYGMLQGVVTMEDLLEELVGEIYDESDRDHEMLRELEPGRIVVEGLTEMRAVLDYFDVELPHLKPTDTVSLWLLKNVGYIPAAKDVFEFDNFRVTVVQASRRFVQFLEICRIPDESTVDAGADAETEPEVSNVAPESTGK